MNENFDQKAANGRCFLFLWGLFFTGDKSSRTESHNDLCQSPCYSTYHL